MAYSDIFTLHFPPNTKLNHTKVKFHNIEPILSGLCQTVLIRIEAKKGPQLRNARRGEGKVVGGWVGALTGRGRGGTVNCCCPLSAGMASTVKAHLLASVHKYLAMVEYEGGYGHTLSGVA